MPQNKKPKMEIPAKNSKQNQEKDTKKENDKNDGKSE